jgi:ABC-type sugar transport system ATPase subunit
VIELNNVSLRHGGFQLENISMKLEKGGLHLLTGKTGAGKTSVVEAICGLQAVEAGEIRLRGIEMTATPPAARSIGYLPQDLVLFDHLSVRGNLQFPCKSRKWQSDRIRDRVNSLAESLGLVGLLDRRPAELSGGQRHTVALGRAFAFEPDIVCLDEPLVALDEQTRETMVDWLRNYIRHNEVTALAVTHQPQWLESLSQTRWAIDSRGGPLVRRV